MNNSELLEILQAEFGDQILKSQESFGLLEIEVSKDQIIPLISWLKNHPTLKFGYLTDLCGVHFPDQASRELGIVYHLHSLENNVRLKVKSFFSSLEPKIESLTGLYAGANWMERETFDFYGIEFNNHPDLRRILNVDEMDYHPLRKEYALEDETRTDKQDKYFGR